MMDEKTLKTLEFPKVLERLAAYAAFSYSAALARELRPTTDRQEVLERQARTTEARHLLSVHDEIGVGGARDVRPQVELARRRGVLEAPDLLEIKNTLIAARELARSVERQEAPYPQLQAISARLAPPPGVVDAISQSISDRGEVLDSASPKLAAIRRELKTAHERLLSRLERMVNDADTAPMLQENLITQRNGRYVIPLRAEFKGRIRAIIHDQSSSGATLFVEPLATVELNNQWHELQLAERDEERRILAELTSRIGLHAEAIQQVVDALAEFDLALMCAKYADDLDACEPVLEPFREQENHPGSTLLLYQARHPLLDPQKVVAIDVDLFEKTFAVVITGPNTGGKTVTLKTVGLLVLMAQSGLHIPAQSGSKLSVFENLFADIGDEQSIEQSLSTFSGHITNIIRVLEAADQRSLVLFDELGAGTDPQEGAALARAILQHLVRRRITCMVATHYPELKAYAHGAPGVVNASMEFDVKTLRPTYHLNIGLPGRSNALLIAQRLGMPGDILKAARTVIDPDELRAEDLLDEIHHQRDRARQARAEADESRREAEKIRAELANRLEHIEDERLSILEKARQQAQNEIAALNREVEDARRALSRTRQPVEDIRELQDKVEKLEAETTQPVERRRTLKTPEARPLRAGDKVHVRSLGMDGKVAAIFDSEVEVQLGSLRVRARIADLQRPGEVEKPAPEPEKKRASGPSAAPENVFYPSPGMELDLRGQRGEDALEELDRYLEKAYLAGLPFVRIIHGKGTGRLKELVRKALRRAEHVKSWMVATEPEGGDGVTVAHMVTE
ncbi:endonuclease MutS2 [Ornatilinea apprima]|nr:endonuclease MutS2 [Ornatilinea apprima]